MGRKPKNQVTKEKDTFSITSEKLYEQLVPLHFNGVHKEKDAATTLGVSENWLNQLRLGNITDVSHDLCKKIYDLGIDPRTYVSWAKQRAYDVVVGENQTEQTQQTTSVPAPKPTKCNHYECDPNSYLAYRVSFNLRKKPTPERIYECLSALFDFEDNEGSVGEEFSIKCHKGESVSGCFKDRIKVIESDEKKRVYTIVSYEDEEHSVINLASRFVFENNGLFIYEQLVKKPLPAALFDWYTFDILKNIVWRFGAKDKEGFNLTADIERYNDSVGVLFDKSNPKCLTPSRLLLPFSAVTADDATTLGWCKELAHYLVGSAHVMIPDSPFVNEDIKDAVKTSIDFPDDNHVLYFCDGFTNLFSLTTDNPKQICETIFNKHFRFPAQEMIDSLPEILVSIPPEVAKELEDLRLITETQNETITALKKELSDCKSELDAFVEDKGHLTEQKESLTRELASVKGALTAKTNALQAMSAGASNTSSVSFFTPERELYAGELSDVVLKVLKKELSTMQDNKIKRSRKYHVLSSIVINNQLTGEDERITEELKVLLTGTGGSNLDGTTIKRLEEMGFTVDLKGVHPKLIFKDDQRYVHFVASTSGDIRGGKNSLSEITRLLFGY